jgi:hypothetical protein
VAADRWASQSGHGKQRISQEQMEGRFGLGLGLGLGLARRSVILFLSTIDLWCNSDEPIGDEEQEISTPSAV